MSVVGFDFGNESCVVAIARQRGIDVALNDESKRKIPANVCFGDKQRFLGGFIWLVMILLLLVFVKVDRKPLVSVLGVPKHMICRFLSVLWFFYPSLVGNANSQVSLIINIQLIRFTSVSMENISLSLEEETCHMFSTVDIQYTGSIELSQSSPGSSAEQPSCPVCLGSLVLLICVTKVAKSAFDKALAEHADLHDSLGSEEPTKRDHGVDLQQPLLIKIDSSDSHQK
ncbi:hypothetical protein OROMI_003829 [Orobanche minor]